MSTGIDLGGILLRGGVGDISGTGEDQPSRGESGKLAQAAQEFEALLLAQVLKSARQPGEGGWLTSGSDQASNTALELAESQLARVLASQGILGIEKLMASNLGQGHPPEEGTVEATPATDLNPAREVR